MSTKENVAAIIVVIGAVLATVCLGFGIPWAIIHGILELGQYSFEAWTWEPKWFQTAFITLAYAFLNPFKKVVKVSD